MHLPVQHIVQRAHGQKSVHVRVRRASLCDPRVHRSRDAVQFAVYMAEVKRTREGLNNGDGSARGSGILLS
jgi:hypothetical protein